MKPLTEQVSELWLRVKALLRRKELERDLVDEIEFHITMRAEQRLSEGLNPSDARKQARRQFGIPTSIKEICRDLWTFRSLETLWQDVRYGARVLCNSPAFTSMAVLSLALGIGANSAIFTLVDAVLLKSLPVENPEELTIIHYSAGKSPRVTRRGSMHQVDKKTGRKHSNVFSYPAYERFREETRTLASVFAFSSLYDVNLVADGHSRIAQGMLVSGNYHTGLGVRPALGRLLENHDDSPEAEAVAVISFQLWQRAFGGEESVIGKVVRINSAPFTIVGVTPPEFFGVSPGASPDVSVPLSTHPAVVRWSQPEQPLSLAHNIWWLNVMGRLMPDATMGEAQSELDVIYSQVLEAGQVQLQEGAKRPEMFLLPGQQGLDTLRWRYSRTLWTLLIVVGLVLLITCVNVANLLLTRATARYKEISVRLAMGAGRRRLVRQLLTENLLLSLLGGALGLLLSYWGSRALLTMVAISADAIRISPWPDARILAFTAGVSWLTGLLFGLVPAMRASQVSLGPALKEGTSLGWTRQRAEGRAPLGRSLIALQVGLSMMLVVGAGLFLHSLQNMRSINLGFRTDHLLVFSLDASLNAYRDIRLLNYYREVFGALEAIPGAVSVTACTNRLLRGPVSSGPIEVSGSPPQDGRVQVLINQVGPRFFKTMDIPIILGRGPTEQDTVNAPRVAFINETLARHVGGGSPLGKTLRWTDLNDFPGITVVGVVKDAKYNSLRDNIRPTVYVPYEQSSWGVGRLDFAVRTVEAPEMLVDSIRSVLRRIDPSVPMMDVTTQLQQIEDRVRLEKVFANISTAFGALALVLACTGIYGVMAYSVARRTGEIGIRIALGARETDIAWLVLRQMLILLAVGTAAGVVGALATTRLVSSMLYGIEANDPLTFTAAAVVMLTVALAASYLPARKAWRLNPVEALRCE